MNNSTPNLTEKLVVSGQVLPQLYASWLNKQGLTERDVANLGLRYVQAAEVAPMLGFNPGVPCALIPYPGCDYFRVRRLGIPNDDKNKYMGSKGSGCSPPFLSSVPGVDWDDIKVDPSVTVGITEGEVKAYFGTTGGVPTIGLGGVDMQATLFSNGWIWKGRNVLVAFDHDAGQERGSYKPGVADALGRLCTSLEAAGATVMVVNIGKVERLDPAKKWGLDDARRASVTWSDLSQTLSKPPEWCEKLSYMLNNCIYVTGENKNHVFNIEDGSRKSPSEFHEAHIEKKRWEESADGKMKVKQISKIWVEHSGRKTARGYSLLPAEKPGFIDEYYADDSAKRGTINMWSGYPDWIGMELEDRSDILEGLDYLLGRLFGEHKNLFRAWVGHGLLKPWEPVDLAWIVTSEASGIGKSGLGDILTKLAGAHGMELSPQYVFGQFAIAGQERAVFVKVDEVQGLKNVSSDKVKNLITQRKRTIEIKGQTAFQIDLVCRYYMTSNELSPLKLGLDNRRYAVVRPDVTSEEAKEWFTEFASHLLGMIDADFNDCMAAIWRYFTEFEGAASYDPRQRAPITEAMMDAVEGGQSTGEYAMSEFMAEVDEEVKDWFALPPPGGKRDGVQNQLRQALNVKLKDRGWVVARKKVRPTPGKQFNNDGGNYHIYARASFGLRVSKPDGVGKEYHVECKDERVTADDVRDLGRAWNVRWSTLNGSP